MMDDSSWFPQEFLFWPLTFCANGELCFLPAHRTVAHSSDAISEAADPLEDFPAHIAAATKGITHDDGGDGQLTV